MKKIILFLAISCFTYNSYAQVPNKDQWTCDGTHENLHVQLDAGKTVVIAMQGLDCAGCNSNAPYLDTFATNNKAKVRVWSALQLMAGSGGTCAGVATWQSTHGYQDVFTFLDSTNYWMTNNTGSEWLVIDPADKKIKYTGFDRDKAFVEARKIFDPTSVGDIDATNILAVYPNPASNVITVTLDEAAQLSIVNVMGQVMFSSSYGRGAQTIDISKYPSGMYVLNAVTDDAKSHTKFLKY